MNKRAKTKTLIFLAILTLIIPITFGAWYDFLKGGMTGEATHSTQLVIGNSTPLITFVGAIANVGLNNAVIGSGQTTVRVWFIANCSNGNEFLDTTSATANFTKAGETTRQTTTCTNPNNQSSYSKNISCDVTMYYYDSPGTWSVNVTINTTSDARATNDSTTFSVNSGMDLNLSAASVTWSTLTVGTTNQSATGSPPITITNIANANISNISINATDLVGQSGTNIGDIFGITGNFTASNTTGTVCGYGTGLQSNTLVYMNLTMTRYSKGTTNQPMYYCIPTVPNLAPGIYNTSMWTTLPTG